MITNLFDECEKGPNEIININQLKEINKKSTKIIEIDLRSLLKVGEKVLELIQSKLEFLNDIYKTYSKYGDKLNDNKMNYAGFHNFMKDNDLIHINKENNTNEILLSNRTLLSPNSKSPLTMRSNNSSSRKLQSFPIMKGKMIDSDVYCIFCSLTGFKNFNTSAKYKNQFDKNKGFHPFLGETGRVTSIDKSSSLSSSRINVPMRMDFNLFLKSLEVISIKLHPEKTLDEAMMIFLESVKISNYKGS